MSLSWIGDLAPAWAVDVADWCGADSVPPEETNATATPTTSASAANSPTTMYGARFRVRIGAVVMSSLIVVTSCCSVLDRLLALGGTGEVARRYRRGISAVDG